jgi:hypothetical protein
MDSGISTVRNLLYIVLVLVVLATASSLYLGTQLAENSDELKRLGELMQQQLMTSATAQSEKIQQKMDQLHQDSQDMDVKMKQERADFMKDLNKQAPDIFGNAMDRYIQKKGPQYEKQALKQFPPQ